jgi:hypothetical protein
VRRPAVELDGRHDLGPGDVELVRAAADPDAVAEHRGGKVGVGQQPHDVELPLGVAGGVARCPLGQDGAQGDGVPRPGADVQPGVAGAERLESQQAAAEGVVDHGSELVHRHRGGAVDQRACRRRDAEGTDAHAIARVEGPRPVALDPADDAPGPEQVDRTWGRQLEPPQSPGRQVGGDPTRRQLRGEDRLPLAAGHAADGEDPAPLDLPAAGCHTMPHGSLGQTGLDRLLQGDQTVLAASDQGDGGVGSHAGILPMRYDIDRLWRIGAVERRELATIAAAGRGRDQAGSAASTATGPVKLPARSTQSARV